MPPGVPVQEAAGAPASFPYALAIESPVNRRLDAHSPSISANTAPGMRMGDPQALDTRPAPMRSAPGAEAALAAFPAGTPPATISETAATAARSTREQRASGSSGK